MNGSPISINSSTTRAGSNDSTVYDDSIATANTISVTGSFKPSGLFPPTPQK
ncbi:hypothetical protein EAMG_05617 [Escherichia coli M056]|nr:hypothetical protein EAMG_05617 [Escherichia coli M056]